LSNALSVDKSPLLVAFYTVTDGAKASEDLVWVKMT